MPMNARTYCIASGCLFTLVALFHLYRALNDIPLVVGDWPVPVALTWLGVVLPCAFAAWAFRLAARQPA